MHNDGILQVSSISPLQAAAISPGMLHPPLGIPLSPHTRKPGRGYGTTHSCCTNPPYKRRIHKLSAAYKTRTALIVSKGRLPAGKHKPQQMTCVSWDLLSVIRRYARFKAV